MELGNLLFGHSSGEFSVPRNNHYEEPFYELVQKTKRAIDHYVSHYTA